MNLDNARVWFGYRSKITVIVKDKISSEFRNNMGCRHCNTEEVESQAHLERSTGTKDMKNLNLTKEQMQEETHAAGVLKTPATSDAWRAPRDDPP